MDIGELPNNFPSQDLIENMSQGVQGFASNSNQKHETEHEFGFFN